MLQGRPATRCWRNRFHEVQSSIPAHFRVAVSESDFRRAFERGKYRLPVLDTRTGVERDFLFSYLLQQKRFGDLDMDTQDRKRKRLAEGENRRLMRKRERGDLKDEVRRAFLHCKGAREKAEDDFDLTCDDVFQMLESQECRCAISGIPFDTIKDFLRPSVDAIDPKKGHAVENCHLVLKVVNYAKNRLTVDEFLDVLDGERDVVYERPNNAKSKEVWRVVDPSLPLNMTARQTYVWKALCDLGEASPRKSIQEYVNTVLRPEEDFRKGNTLTSLRLFVQGGYVEQLGKGTHKLYRRKEALAHAVVRCSACSSAVPLPELQSRPNRAENFAPLGGGVFATNQTKNCCRPCRTKRTTHCRNRDRANYVWSKIAARKNADNGRKDGDLTKDDLASMCAELAVCPIAGIPLSFTSGWSPNQASPDRVDNDRGYFKDNVRIVSLLANYARQRTTISDEELRFVLTACLRATRDPGPPRRE